MSITCRPISADQHLAFIRDRGSASFLQTPAWAAVKPEWRGESIGFFDGATLTGVGLILYRQLPKLKRYLAYLPEGPVLDWGRADVADHLRALVGHAKRNRAFAVRIGPTVVHRRWAADTIKAAIADDAVTRLSDVEPDETTLVGTRIINQLIHGGWVTDTTGHGFAAGQPMFNFQLPLRHADGTQKSDDELLKGMNQLWRRNIKKADKEGVTVRQGDRADLAGAAAQRVMWLPLRGPGIAVPCAQARFGDSGPGLLACLRFSIAFAMITIAVKSIRASHRA